MEVEPVIVRSDKWNLVFFAFIGVLGSALGYFSVPPRPSDFLNLAVGSAIIHIPGWVIVSLLPWLIMLPMMVGVGWERITFCSDSFSYTTLFSRQNLPYTSVKNIELIKAYRGGAPLYFLYITTSDDSRHQIAFSRYSRRDSIRIVKLLARHSPNAIPNDLALQFAQERTN